MPPLLRHLFAWTALLAFVVGAKLHLPLVQAAGWARMTYNYAQLMPVDEAFETAVSGRELCAVCAYVRNAEHTKRATDALFEQSTASHLLASLPDIGGAIRFAEVAAPEWTKSSDRFAEPRTGPPALRPPKPLV